MQWKNLTTRKLYHIHSIFLIYEMHEYTTESE